MEFTFIQQNSLNNQYMLFAKFSNMPQTAYGGTKSEIKKLKIEVDNYFTKKWETISDSPTMVNSSHYNTYCNKLIINLE